MENKRLEKKGWWRDGVYETIYGNACLYEGGNTAWDLDMNEEIPIEMVDFNKWIREF
jgi:hypothetical protein